MSPDTILLLVILTTSHHISHRSAQQIRTDSIFNWKFVHSEHFVDKTEMIRIFYNESHTRWNLLGAPPQFGKTTNLHMLKTFFGYEIDQSKGVPKKWNETSAYEIFKNLKIAKYDSILTEHLAQHPVIYLDLKFTIPGVATEEKILSELQSKIRQCYLEHEWILEKIRSNQALKSYARPMEKALTGQLDRNGLAESIFSLGSILYKYFNQSRVIVLVDNYDHALNEAFLQQKSGGDYIHKLINGAIVFGKGHVFRSLGLILGNSLLQYDLGHTAMNEIRGFNFLRQCEFTDYFGFTEVEMVELFDKFNCGRIERTNLKKWYNGYLTSNHHRPIYNPYSVSRYFIYRLAANLTTPRAYWSLLQDPMMVLDFLDNADFRNKLIDMLKNGILILPSTRLETYESIPRIPEWKTELGGTPEPCVTDEALRYVFEMGYFAYAPSNDETFVNHEYKIPNWEIEEHLCDILSRYYSSQKISVREIRNWLIEIIESPDAHENFTLADQLQQTLDYVFSTVVKPKFTFYTEYLNAKILEYHSIIYVAALQTKFALSGVDVVPNELFYYAEREDIFIKKNDTVVIIRINTDIEDEKYSPREKAYSRMDRNSTSFKLICINVNETHLFNVALMGGYRLPYDSPF